MTNRKYPPSPEMEAIGKYMDVTDRLRERIAELEAALMKRTIEQDGILEIDSEYLETGIFCPACGEVLYSPDGKQIVCCNDTCLRRYRLEEATE